MNRKKGKKGQRLLTALLCLTLCAADIMPMSMTAWASEQMPQNSALDDNMPETTDEGDYEDQDQSDAKEGEDDSENYDDSYDTGDQDGSDDNSEEGDEPAEDHEENEEELNEVIGEPQGTNNDVQPLQDAVSGDTFIKDYVIYEVISEEARTVKVKGMNRAEFNSKYLYDGGSSGGPVELTIPASVESSGITYSVIEIGEFALADYTYNGTPSDDGMYDEPIDDDYLGFNLYISKVIVSSGITKIDKGAFYKSFQINEIVLPDTIEEVGEAAFYFNELKRNSSYFEPLTVNIPASVKAIGDYAYHGVYFDRILKVPNGVGTIGGYAFACSSEASGIYGVYIPESVKSIGMYAFDIATLMEAAFERTDIPFSTNDNQDSCYERWMFGDYHEGGNNLEPTKLTLYVRESLMDTYSIYLSYYRPSLQVRNLNEYSGIEESPIRFLYRDEEITDKIVLPISTEELTVSKTVTVDTGDGDFLFSDIHWSFELYGTDVELAEDELHAYLTYTVNNADGMMSFTGVGVGNIIVSATVDGYLPKSFNIGIIDGYSNEDFLALVQAFTHEDIERMRQITYSDEISFQLEVIRDKALEITDGCTGEYDKILAIHTWLANNIAYNYDRLSYVEAGDSGSAKPVTCSYTPYEVLMNRSALCGGFANLAETMLRSIGIPCAVISGYASGDFYEKRCGHAWNMAYDSDDDRWIYFDSTWDCIGSVKDYNISSVSVDGDRQLSWFDFDVEETMEDGREFRSGNFEEIYADGYWNLCQLDMMTLFVGEEGIFQVLTSDQEVTFTLSPDYTATDIIEINEHGNVKALRSGSVEIDVLLVSQATGQTTRWLSAVRVCVLEKKSFAFEEAELTVGMEDDREACKVYCLLNGNYVNPFVEMTSDNPSVLTVEPDGTLNIKSTGTATVTAELLISSAVDKSVTSCTITVVEGTTIASDEKFKYRIVSEPSGSQNGTVEIIDSMLGKLGSMNTNMVDVLEIPAIAELGGQNYNVIGIGKEGLAKHWEFDDVMPWITKIILPDTIQYIGKYAFHGYKASSGSRSMNVTINFPASIQRIEEGAFGSFQLEGNVIFPEGSQLSYLGKGAFSENGYLESVDLSNCSMLKTIGDEAFSSCGYKSFVGDKYPGVKLPEGLITIGTRAFKGYESLSSITIPSTVKSVGDEAFMSTSLTGTVNLGSAIQIGEGVFRYTDGIETVILSDELDNIPKELFNGTHNLKNVISKSYYEEAGRQIEDGTFLLPTGIKSIGDDAFRGTDLTGTIDISGVSSIGQGVFASCGEIETVILPDALDEIPNETFRREDNLKNVLSKSCLDRLGGIDHVTDGTVLLSDTMTRIGNYAFEGCYFIQSVEARGIKELGKEVFGNCYELKTISLSDELAVIPDRTFWYCRALEEFDFGDNIEAIGAETFSNCTKLGQSTDGAIVIGSSIKTIGNEAFRDCSSISEVTIYSKVIESVGANCFSSNPVLYVYELPSGIYERALGGCVSEIIYLPDESVAVLTEKNTTVILPQRNPIYNGYPQRPDPTVIVSIDGKEEMVVKGTDYTVSYQNNINAGVATVIITGMGSYSGIVRKNFTIDKAELTIQAKDITLAIGDSLPITFPYEAIGLVSGDEELLGIIAYSYIDQKGQYINRENIDTTKPGVYYVTVQVDAGDNYEIMEYRKGKLTIAEERVGYTVIFDLMGHGKEIEIPGIKAGSLIKINELEEQSDIAITRDGEFVTEENGQYVFTGWYKDTTFAAKQKWNFDTDTVQADITLYACWIEKAAEDGSGLQLSIQDIQDQYFTGSAIKPTVYVYTADGKTLLKSGKDYTIKYTDNTNVGEALVTITGKGNYKETVDKNFTILPADISADDENVAAGFTLKYSDQIVVNKTKDQKPFTSLKYKKAMILWTDYEITLTAGDDVRCAEGVEPAEWITNKESKGTDYNETTKKATAPLIPKGYSGTFTMTVRGKGNYRGTFTKEVKVTDRDHLMKNASISLGKNLKNKDYKDGEEVTLTAGYCETITEGKKKKTQYYEVDRSGKRTAVADAKDIFLVKAGSKYLIYGEDYKISYTNNRAVGTATMTIEGMGDYLGTKSVTFKIKGTAFNTKNVTIVEEKNAKPEETGLKASKSYTGRAITQNNVTLKPSEAAIRNGTSPEPLIYGKHYTISYKNNIKKGTATMTFTAKPESGYSGSFKKTFKITAQSIAAADVVKVGAVQSEGHEQDSIVGLNNAEGSITGYRLNGNVAYVKGGVKPSDRIVLTNSGNITLKEGSDYTVKYKNNTALTAPDMEDSKKPYMTVTGKGNYTGTLTIYFDITQAELTEGQITVTPVALSTKDNYEYKPSVKVVDNVSGKALSAGENKDYTITYENNGQENVRKYVSGDESAAQPMAVVKVPSSGTGSYKLSEGVSEIKVPLPIYQTKLTSSNLYVSVSEDPAQITYTGDTGTDERIRPVTPDVTVYYGEAAAVKAAKQNKVTDETELTKQDGAYKLIKLKEVSAVSDGQTDTASSGTGDYTVSYGANVTAGKNKGTVTITGTGVYGGSVTVKFEILKRSVYITPQPDVT